jgi:hypothetical protein
VCILLASCRGPAARLSIYIDATSLERGNTRRDLSLNVPVPTQREQGWTPVHKELLRQAMAQTQGKEDAHERLRLEWMMNTWPVNGDERRHSQAKMTQVVVCPPSLSPLRFSAIQTHATHSFSDAVVMPSSPSLIPLEGLHGHVCRCELQ